jgi:hypothetical protein
MSGLELRRFIFGGRPGFFPGKRSTSNPSGRGWGAHCDAALAPMVSVDHAGKLFERIEIGTLDSGEKQYINNNTGIPPRSASFCPRHGNHRGQGAFRSAGPGFFCYFSLPAKEK